METTYHIINARDYHGEFAECVHYFHSKWGSDNNYSFYLDAMSHSPQDESQIPQFYLLLCDDEIVGSYGLIINDFVSRHDLYPWLCSLYIEPEHRGQKLSQRLFEHAANVVKSMGLRSIYLTTDHADLYEKFGWVRLDDGYEPTGDATRVYELKLD